MSGLDRFQTVLLRPEIFRIFFGERGNYFQMASSQKVIIVNSTQKKFICSNKYSLQQKTDLSILKG